MLRPTFSLIVPTRGRPEKLRTFLDSITRTARHPDRIEVVLVMDEDDAASHAVEQPRLKLVRTIGAAGRTMGELNRAGYAAASGDFIMLLNDDVIVRTRGWDAIAAKQFRRFPDPFVLVHVNDLLISHHLCVFPLVSRAFCELDGGICPPDYRRYRIDDHIEDPFNMLAHLGVRRTVYLPDVIFEHTNAATHVNGQGVYQSDPVILAEDARRFEELLGERKELALRMLGAIDGTADIAVARRSLLAITDSFALRTVARQRMVRSAFWKRMQHRFRQEGMRGLVRSIKQRFMA